MEDFFAPDAYNADWVVVSATPVFLRPAHRWNSLTAEAVVEAYLPLGTMSRYPSASSASEASGPPEPVEPCLSVLNGGRGSRWGGLDKSLFQHEAGDAGL